MVLRCPKPIGPEDWARLVANLDKGPTPKQVEIMKEAEEKWGKDLDAEDDL